MKIAVIKNDTCIDIVKFNDIETAQEFLSNGVWANADSVIELPDGYGIGDFYSTGEWTKAPQPESPTPPEPGPTQLDIMQSTLDALVLAALEG